jgi:hypothetical protein
VSVVVQGRGPIRPVDPEGDPWERIEGETSAAYTKFVVYRDQTRGRHSLAKAAKELGLSLATLKELSMQHRWVERSELYDDYLERRDRNEREQQRDIVNRQGYKMAQAGLAAAITRFTGGKFGDIDVEGIDPNTMDIGDLAKVADVFWKMARLATGQPTDAIRGLVTVTTEDHKRIVDALYQITMHVLPDDRKQRFATLWDTFLDTGRLPWS